MAKTSQVHRDLQRKVLIAKFKDKRAALRANLLPCTFSMRGRRNCRFEMVRSMRSFLRGNSFRSFIGKAFAEESYRKRTVS